MQARGAIGRIDAEEQTDGNGNAEGQEHRWDRDDRRWKARARNGWNVLRLHGQRSSEGDAQRAAKTAEDHGLDQELREHVTPPGADRFADPDLACPLCDGDQHDVHDSDPAHHQGYAGDGSKDESQRGGDGVGLVQDVLLALQLEIALRWIGDLVALQQDGRELGLGLSDRARRRGRGDDLADVLAASAAQVGPHGGDWCDHDVVLRTKSRPAFGRKDTDDPKALAVDLDRLADWISGTEQVGDDSRAEDDDAMLRCDVVLREERAFGDLVVAHLGEVHRAARGRSEVVLVRVGDLAATLCNRNRSHDVGILLPAVDGVDVGHGQGLAGAETLRDAARAPGVRRVDEDDVGAEGLDLVVDLHARAVADRDQQDHRRDPDEYPEHGQRAAEPVGQKAGERDAQRLEDVHAARRSSVTIKPSWSATIRLANAAISRSWVIKTMVRACSRLSSVSSFMISTLDALSRLPVGSSASRIAGLVTSARAMAARCCWPPESSVGWWPARSARPTDSRAACARVRRFGAPA